MNNFNDLKAPLTWALGIVFIVCIFMLNANTIKVPTGVGTGDAWNPTQNMQEWNFDNSTGAFVAGMLSNEINHTFNFGTPSSADILFFEEEEVIDIEALIEEIIAEMDAEDDSTATSPNEE